MYSVAKGAVGEELVAAVIRFTAFRKYGLLLVESSELFPLSQYLSYVKGGVGGAGGDEAGELKSENEKKGVLRTDSAILQ